MEIWTDGACEPNPGLGGWGWHRGDGAMACGGDRETTSNRMEMTAILEAMRALPDGATATIHSDSQYCVKGMTEWAPGWKRRNWHRKDGSEMPNRDLWLALNAECDRLKVRFQWVKGHNGDPGNELADRLAEEGRRVLCPA